MDMDIVIEMDTGMDTGMNMNMHMGRDSLRNVKFNRPLPKNKLIEIVKI